jgi:hypothetical protein
MLRRFGLKLSVGCRRRNALENESMSDRNRGWDQSPWGRCFRSGGNRADWHESRDDNSTKDGGSRWLASAT